jgi:hypothetical protein
MGFDVEEWLAGWRVALPAARDLRTGVSLAREDAFEEYAALADEASPTVLDRLLDDATAAVVASLDPTERAAITEPGLLLDALEAAVFTITALGLQYAAARNGRERWTALLTGTLERVGVEPPQAVVVELAGRRG